ncbi:hypothetical protein GPECTOR_81g217 [Gonium pectorale]|uniref:Uncharacterized protein n=1 Tax=Gonium pectorale TaxID=33097 RepID=A0A150G1P0_GONPE|nr:hypothetical protein GPECTOR_81g217 [Gonium pectorale]|eukprot:KXZ43767.1 hypothetical protein GPECTOR_81g217 [Gonium pectorale]
MPLRGGGSAQKEEEEAAGRRGRAGLGGVDQLAEPYDEAPAAPIPVPWQGSRGDFRATIKSPSTGLFGTDADYWRTVHGNREAERRAAAVAEAEAWRRRLVVADPVMRTTLPTRPPRPAQPDRLAHMLQARPPGMRPKEDFKHMTSKPKTAVHKPPFNQSWSASLHDKYYSQ